MPSTLVAAGLLGEFCLEGRNSHRFELTGGLPVEDSNLERRAPPTLVVAPNSRSLYRRPSCTSAPEPLSLRVLEPA